MKYSLLYLFLFIGNSTPLIAATALVAPRQQVTESNDDDDEESVDDEGAEKVRSEATSSDVAASPGLSSDRAIKVGNRAEETVATESDGIAYGDVYILSTAAEFPLGKGWTFLAGLDLIRTRELNVTAWRPYAQAGLGLPIAASWRLELVGEYGPTAFNLGRVGATAAISNSYGTSTYSRSGPKLELRAEITGRRYWWANGQGLAGSDLFQANVELSALLNIARWQISIQESTFLYDRSLIPGRSELDRLTELARSGSYAPSWFAGITVGRHLAEWLMPFVTIEEIGYAADVGSGTLLSAGGEIQLRSWLNLRLQAGTLYNRVDPDLSAQNSWLPVVGLGISVP